MAPSIASAQWLPDRVRTEGDGFRTDSTEIHTSFSAEAGVDSNVFLQSANRTAAALMRLTGAVAIRPRRITSDTPQEGTTDDSQNRKIDFNVGLSASYYHFFTQFARDNLSGTLDASVRFRPQGRVGFELREVFTRGIRPFTDASTNGSRGISYGQNRSATTANLLFRTPGGVIQGNVGYTGDLTFFDAVVFQGNNSAEHRVQARLVWSFFPRTALVYESTAAFRSYGVGSSASSYAALSSSRRVSSTIGVNGVLSTKLSLTLAAGYGAGFYATGSEYDGFLARAELRYRVRPGVTLTAGYARDYAASYIGNFAQTDTGYINSEMAFTGRFLIGSQMSVGYGRTGQALLRTGGFLGNYQQRVDLRALVRLYGEYRPTSYLAITLNLEYLGDFTTYTFVTPSGVTGVLPDPPAQYQRFDAWLGVRVFH